MFMHMFQELRIERKEKGEEWLRRERCLREWEDELEMREGKVGGVDRDIEDMMKELKLKENEVKEKDIELKDLREELDDKVRRFREDMARELKVLLYILSVLCFNIVFLCLGV